MNEKATVELHKELKKINANVLLTRRAVLSLRDRVAALEEHMYSSKAAPMVRRGRRKRRTSS